MGDSPVIGVCSGLRRGAWTLLLVGTLGSPDPIVAQSVPQRFQAAHDSLAKLVDSGVVPSMGQRARALLLMRGSRRRWPELAPPRRARMPSCAAAAIERAPPCYAGVPGGTRRATVAATTGSPQCAAIARLASSRSATAPRHPRLSLCSGSPIHTRT